MIEIYTQFERCKRISTPSGSKFLNLYQEEINDGCKTLVKTGVKDMDEIIQMDLENTKIENILHNFAMGDFSALRKEDGTYTDATTMPKTLQEAQNLVIRLKNEFEKMPTEVKNQFNNSPDKYVELMGTKEFNEIMAPYNEKIAKIAEEKNYKEYMAKVKSGAKLNYDIRKEEEYLKALEGGKE